jgi:hypothetical protein
MPCDFLWDYVKHCIYTTPLATANDLQTRTMLFKL